MSVAVQQDFLELCDYLRAYSLGLSVNNPEYVKLIKRAHRKFLAALTFSAESEAQNTAAKKPTKRNQAAAQYFKESVSDLGCAVFCLCNGAYKPGRVMLRSALETLAKGLAVSKSLRVLKEKSVHSVISEAKEISLFSHSVPAVQYARLETYYSLLCEDVHTAGIANMAHVSSMAAFPGFDLSEARQLEDLFSKVSTVVLSIQVMFLKENYNKMHFSNRPIVRQGIHRDVVKYLSGEH